MNTETPISGNHLGPESDKEKSENRANFVSLSIRLILNEYSHCLTDMHEGDISGLYIRKSVYILIFILCLN